MTTLLQRCTEAVAKLSPDREPHVHVAQVRAVLAVIAEHCDWEVKKWESLDCINWIEPVRRLASDLRREN